MRNKFKAVVTTVLALSVFLGLTGFKADGNLLAVATLANNHSERISLSPGGVAFGVKYFTKGALVVGITDIETAQGLQCPARDAGLSVKDIITSINGKEIKNAEDFQKTVNACEGKSIEVKYIRDGVENSLKITPVVDKNENVYKLGLWVRDSTAGIGTITFVDRKSGRFGGLGHGICDSETGTLLPLDRGIIVNVKITEIVTGKKNAPGEIKGVFDRFRRGELTNNSEVGVFGILDEIPSGIGEEIPIGFKNELQTGKAYIITTLDAGRPEEFEIEIEKIYPDSGPTKNFMIKITDSDLIARTGGIIQGMSGSPIIQNGKLVGAVTHVLVGDSTRGYGIHIENMLAGMQK
ncbi:MAG TPA: SpoIVB peptidase [Bacillota bacterium]|nr:SpoIVB peptidase [Bacillota bacterium]HOK68971.1 SpoIVB peptidase [Bacillota bacterium]HPP85388.1 SpoIVB peptidase [Bacillota bacterium]